MYHLLNSQYSRLMEQKKREEEKQYSVKRRTLVMVEVVPGKVVSGTLVEVIDRMVGKLENDIMVKVDETRRVN